MNDYTTEKIAVFGDQRFGKIRVIGDMFIAGDLCAALEHSDTSMACSRLDDDEKLVQALFVSGQTRNVLLVTESGMYHLILTARTERAKEFRRWVTETVLPAIHKTGAYIPPQMTPAEMLVAQAQLMVALERRVRSSEGKIERIAEAAAPILNDQAQTQFNNKIRSVCHRYGQDYLTSFHQLYAGLEAEAHCDLETRISNKRKRLAEAGATQTAVEGVSKLAVICEDGNLVAHFDRIIQRWAMHLAARYDGGGNG